MAPPFTRRRLLRIGGALSAIGLAGCLGRTGAGGPRGTKPDGTVDEAAYEGDRFEGLLTAGVGSTERIQVGEGVYAGVVTYDRSCIPIGDGRTACDAGIRTDELGERNFHYEHDMQVKPCLTPPETVLLVVSETDTVVRRKR